MRIAHFKDGNGKRKWLILRVEKDSFGDVWIQFKFNIPNLPSEIEGRKKEAGFSYKVYIERKNGFEIKTWWYRINVPSDYTLALNDSILKAYVEFFRLCGLNLSFGFLKEVINRIKFISKL